MKNLFTSSRKLSKPRLQVLETFQKKIGIKFKNISLLDNAFHHRSFSNEYINASGNNERLEFLGDAVLGLVVANYLYKTYGAENEGELARIKSVVVSEATLSKVALEIQVDTCLSLGKGEEKSGGRSKKAILADALEAIFGAFYIDSGLNEVEKFIVRLLKEDVINVHSNLHIKDYKTLLQEFFQKKHKKIPVYKIENKTGPDHDQTFWVTVSLCETSYGPKSGKTKKEAEQAAAKFAWESINI